MKLHLLNGAALAVAFATLSIPLATSSVHADEIRVTLSNAAFDDSTSLNGYYDYDTESNTLGYFSFTTKNGPTGDMGTTYSPDAFSLVNISPTELGIQDTVTGNALYLNFDSSIDNGDTSCDLIAGSVVSPHHFDDSGEATANGLRMITSGKGLITSAPAAPEASSSASFAALLAAGAGALILRRKLTA